MQSFNVAFLKHHPYQPMAQQIQFGVSDDETKSEDQLLTISDNNIDLKILDDGNRFTVCNFFYILMVICLLIGTFAICQQILDLTVSTSLLIAVNVTGIVIAIFYTLKGYRLMEKDHNLGCCRRLLKVVVLAWAKRGIYASLFTVITTEAANYALITDFYSKSYANDSNTDTNNNDNVNYYILFWLSVFILIFHRVISAILMYAFSLKCTDFFLQLLDLKVFDIVYISWRYDYNESTTIQNYISLIRLIFESTPKALISIHLLIINNVDFIYWYSAIWSIIIIASGNIAEDTNYFKQHSHARDIGWNRDNGCKCNYKRCCYINVRFIIRYIWRYNDVIIHILLVSYAWYFISGAFVIYNLLFEFLSLLFLSILNKCGVCCHSKELFGQCACFAPIEWNMFTGLISTFPNSTDMSGESVYRITSGAGIFCSWYRHIWNLAIAMYGIFIVEWFADSILPYLLLFMVILNIYLYVIICGRYSYCICTCDCWLSNVECKNKNGEAYLGENWTVMNYYNTRSLAGVSTKKDLITLLRFGYKLTPNAAHEGNWYWMEEPWKVAKYISDNYPHVKLDDVEFAGIGPLHLLSQNIHITDENEINEAFTYFIQKLKYDVNQKEKQWGKTPLMEAAMGKNKSKAAYYKVKVLLDNNADVMVKNNRGRTVFNYYMREDVEALLETYRLNSYI